MPTPIQIATLHTADFLSRWLRAGSSVLEVGCGKGDVAVELANRGYDVSAIDIDPADIALAKARGVHAEVATWPDYHADPVGAVVFTRSLHHIFPLDRAIARACDVLHPGGSLLLEELAHGEPSDDLLPWFLSYLRRDDVRSLIRPVPEELVTDLLAAENPLAVWRGDADADHHQVHSFRAIEEEVAISFDVRGVERVPYLYRYLIPVLSETETSGHVTELLYRDEHHLGDRMLGRRLVGTKRTESGLR